MTELYFLRHADAGDPEKWTRPDAERPLSSKGKRQTEHLAWFLESTGFRPDAILTSPKVRAEQTARPIAERLGVKLTIEPRLGQPLDLATLDSILADAGDPERVVVAGHDPDFSDLVSQLTGLRDFEMKKGAFLRIDVDRPLRAGAGRLVWLVPPILLKERTEGP
jgi:phosphohistidine phosphatase SixA